MSSRLDIAWPLDLDDLERRLGSRPHRRVIEGEEWNRAAVALILRPQTGPPGAGLEALFIRRAEHPLDPWSGHMAFPGGRFDREDPDLLATAVRETREEVGLDLSPARRLGRLHDVQAGIRRNANLAVTPWVFGWRGEAPLTLSEEVAEALWVPLPHLADPERRVEHPWEREGVRYRFPGIAVGPRTIWGLTLAMVEDFLQAMRG